MLKYSVIIPVYNVEEYLPKCVESVLRQNASAPFEILLVDDGSTDGSGALCDELARGDDRIQVIHQPNKWLSAARNTGLRAASGEYVLFLDSDDWWQPELLATIDSLADEQVDLVSFGGTRIYTAAPAEPFAAQTIPSGQSGEEYLQKSFVDGKLPLPFACVYVYRRQFLLDNELFFNEKLRSSEDFEFNMRVIPLAQKITGTDKALYNYLQRGGSLTASMSGKKVMDNLRCKADVFRRYPVPAVAREYIWNALLIPQVPRAERKPLITFVRQNRDILRCVAGMQFRLASLLIRLFGCVAGAKCFWALAEMKKKVKNLLRK